MLREQNKKQSKLLLPRVIAISSGKGGVGKSSITVNLAITLAKKGVRVCLLDADTGLANANILLGLTPQFSLEHVLYGAKSIEEVMLDGPHGLKIVPGANGISECVNLHPRQQLRLSQELARIESDFDYMLVDTAAGVSETTLDFISASHHTLIVITPEPTSLTDAFSLIKLLKRRRNAIHYQVVVNMCSSAMQAREIYQRFCAAVEKYIGVHSQFLGYLLRDESMRAAVMLQNPVAMFPDTDPSCRGFVKLADALQQSMVDIPEPTSFSDYWQKHYRARRTNQLAAPGKVSEKPEATPEAGNRRDSDYLSELRSRLILLIEDGHTEQDQLQQLLQEGIEAFSKRFKVSPVDNLKLVEQLLLEPERDDQVLRDIAELVAPWSVLSNTPPTAELVEKSTAGDDQQPVSPGIPEANPDLSSPPLLQVEVVDQSPGPKMTATTKVSSTVSVINRYDSNRFGSQEKLVDILQRDVNSDKPLTELLATLV